MHWIKNLLKPKTKPYFDNSANEKYDEFYSTQNRIGDRVIYKVLREIRHNGRDVCSIDFNLNYNYQFKNGKCKQVNLKKAGRRKGAVKLFERMNSSIDEIKHFNSKLRPVEDDNLILFTYFTNIGIYQDVYNIDQPPKKGISVYLLIAFWNYAQLVDKRTLMKL